jgi:hypothetical protein
MIKKIAELHTDHRELISEITFLKTELGFLFKFLNKEYSNAINKEKIGLLDTYYAIFEKNINELEALLKEIQEEEKNMIKFFPDKKLLPDGKEVVETYYKINKEIRALKESFYGYIIETNHESK